MGVVVSILLLLISISDIKEKKIPNRLLGIFLLCAFISAVTCKETLWAERFAGAVSVSGILLLIILWKPGAFGAGDVKLMAVSGFFLGIWKNLAAFMFAVILAGMYCAVCLVMRKKERLSEIAFGPFLCMGILLALFFGEAFLAWYV